MNRIHGRRREHHVSGSYIEYSHTIALQSGIHKPNKHILWLLAAAGSALFLGLAFLGLLKRHLKKTDPSKDAERRIFLFRPQPVSLLWGSTASALVTAISITQTVSTLQFSTASLQATTIITSGLVL